MSVTEKLITYVKQHPCLFNTRERDYRNSIKKELLWEKISKDLKLSRDAAKVKWKNLKDGYNKHKKNARGTTGQKRTYNNWVWAPYLQFLDDYTEQRPTASNITPIQQDDTTATISISWSPPRANSPLSQPSSSRANSPILQPPTTKANLPTSELPSSSAESPPTAPPPKHTPKKRMSDQDSVEKVLDYLKNKKKKQDAVDHLFASYAESFKNLKPRTQASVKLKLAEIFVEAELEDLDSENQRTQMYSPVYSLVSAISENQEYSHNIELIPVDLTLISEN